jgi:hypothetical protein
MNQKRKINIVYSQYYFIVTQSIKFTRSNNRL